tara:strand:- start:976 stop:1845 length:870 start_codon:yes stop_codon:yes gene_type:complete
MYPRKRIHASYLKETPRLSVVIQGPIVVSEFDVTKTLVEKIRNTLPSCEIILSTWLGEDSEGINCLVLKNPDPGVVASSDRFLKNSKRLQTSTLSGLKAATGEYCLKLRSDHTLEPAKLTRIFDLISSGKTTLLMHSAPWHLFLIDDKAQFGRLEDLIKLWDFNFDEQYAELHTKFKSSKTLSVHAKIRGGGPYFDQILTLTSDVKKKIHKFNLLELCYCHSSLLKSQYFYVPASSIGIGSVKHDYSAQGKTYIYVAVMNYLNVKLLTIVFFIICILRQKLTYFFRRKS